MSKKISIITINFNNKNGLEKTVISVVNQTWKDFEFIVIDGASTDGSTTVADKYQHQLSQYLSEPDHGVYHAMNKAIKRANGDYLLFLNSGDVLAEPNTLEKVQKHLDGRFGFYYGDAIYLEPDGEITRTYPDQLSFSFFLAHNLSHQATFIKRKLFDEVFPYNENYKIVSDWEFFIYAICKINIPYQHLDQVICKYDVSGISSVLTNHKLMHEEREQTISNYFPLFIDDYKDITALKSKRFQQFLHIKKYKLGYKVLKAFMSVILIFLPKNKN
ncbi:glycosyltransferase involved in cell wall biosynthesis [Flavobacterium sp. W4I14]|nr:glycosyltransferase involved in cell wall biosynthesis [Flavobacterium sp. W4I14]